MGTAEAWRGIDWSRHLGEVTVDGRRVKYVDHGDGPPLLLVHGMAGSWETWLANIPALSESHRVIAVDLPGFGGSDPLPEADTFDGYVRTLEVLLDELAIPSVAVVGHSLGGLVALSFAAALPERVRCLVLVSGGGAELSAARLRAIRVVFWCLAAVLTIPGAHRLLTTPAVVRAVTKPAIHSGRDVPVELLRRMMPRRVGPGFMDAVSRGSAQLAALEPRRITAPVLLVWGRHDRILPVATGQQLDRSLLQSRLVVMEEAGHCAMFEQPEEFLALATNFLDMQLIDRKGPATDRASARSWEAPRAEGDAANRYGDGNAG
ncbi:alpha/beta fold hydrolase [Nocardioides humilatus]|uniref:alpha/beta fold hydrolase n=1 Tax=Nocardioides humilatus TaxID=2607660 RepID=UPI00165FA8E2|nr:alpha/beta fold hydrolase [Nocardioides humilatus]